MIATILFAAALNCAAFHIDPAAAQPLAPVASTHAPGSCHVRHAANGMQMPDPVCTPGAVNPTVTASVLKDPAFRTGCIRGHAVSESQSDVVYTWYGVPKPLHNKGPGQLCEKDHLISLGLGGADALANLWPQCGPANVPVGKREFKVKDAHAELGLMRDIKAGAELSAIQSKIAADWTQFITPSGP